MSNAALFIDFPNFYSRLLKSGIEDPRYLRNYVLEWLDFDRLARSLTETYTGIWVFYSGERVGPSSERLSGDILRDYIRRINALEGVTARDVNIPGEQREAISYKCDKCGNEGRSEIISEKGIDSSLTVHLFDTMDSWDVAYLLTGDADFVPAVASLRRRGKIVVGVGFPDVSAALVRECYHYVNLQDVYLNEDLFSYTLCRTNGVLHQWLGSEVTHDLRFGEPEKIGLSSRLVTEDYYASTPPRVHRRYIHLSYTGSIDLSTRQQMMTELMKKYPGRIRDGRDQNNRVTGYSIDNFSLLAFETIKSRVPSNLSSIRGLTISQENNFWVTYERKAKSGLFVPVTEESSAAEQTA